MIIVGLGNPGKKYEKTRHNVGFMFLDALAEAYNLTFHLEKKHQCLITEMKIDDEKIVLMKPITYMNNSGLAVKSVLEYYHYSPQEVLIIYDDMDLPLASIRIRKNGSSGGHKGMKSVIDMLGTEEIARIRIGIGDSNQAIDYVLSKFKRSETKIMNDVLGKAPYIINDLVNEGFDYIMNHYNG